MKLNDKSCIVAAIAFVAITQIIGAVRFRLIENELRDLEPVRQYVLKQVEAEEARRAEWNRETFMRIITFSILPTNSITSSNIVIDTMPRVTVPAWK